MELKDMVTYQRPTGVSSKVKVKVLPDWIFRAIARNKLNVVDIEDYSKIRSFLSLEDLAIWEFLNTRFDIQIKSIADLQLATIDLFDLSKLTPEQQREYQSVRTLSTTDENKNTAYAKLTSPLDAVRLDGNNINVYKFIPTHNFIALVISEGFISEMNDPNKLKAFIANYLEHCYFMASVDEVSQLPMFNTYLRLL